MVHRLIVALALVAGAVAVPGVPVDAEPPGDDEVIAFAVRGVGNGHGRGMSQWGGYGRALAGQSWEEILEAYYGGTDADIRVEPHMRVRLLGWDGTNTLGVVSDTGAARWNDDSNDYVSLYAEETSSNVFSVFGASERGCPNSVSLTVPFVDMQIGSGGSDVRDLQQLLNYFDFDAGPVDGDFGPLTEAGVKAFQAAQGLEADGLWRIEDANAAQQLLDQQPGVIEWEEVATGVEGPIRFHTTVDQGAAEPGEVLGLCKFSGSIVHYRGDIEFHHISGGNRVVNDLDVENYLRGVLPKEVSPSWGDHGDGAGMNSLRAQAVAARSFGMSQNRYSYAATCDSSSCQVYGGAASRAAAVANTVSPFEAANTDQAIVDTAGVVRVWPDGAGPNAGEVVSTEFSASNGPRTAGGAFPSVDDPLDDVPANPYHRWTRVIDADSLIARYGLSSANDVETRPDDDSPFEGIWANEVFLGDGKSPVSAWDFRNSFGLRSPGFELIPITRGMTEATTFAFIGNSVGQGIAAGPTATFQVVTDGAFEAPTFDSVSGRTTIGGLSAVDEVPIGTEVVVVELGYNDSPSAMPERIDDLMAALREREVGLVLWVNVSERRTSVDFATTNAALNDAMDRWTELVVLDWNRASSSAAADRWFSDGVHLTATGNAEFSLWLRDQIFGIVLDGYEPPRPLTAGVPLRVPIGDIAPDGATGVALNVTAVGPVGPGFLRVWPCGSVEPETSSVNFVAAGSVEPNAVVVPVDESGEVCVSGLVETDVIVDVSGWFDAGLRSAVGRVVDTRDDGVRLVPGEVLRVGVLGEVGVPVEGVVGVALNVTAVGPVGPGFLRVWPCGSVEPETSSVNFVAAGSVEPNAVVVPVDESGEVCVSGLVETDVIVDVSGWFDAGLRSAVGRVVDTRDDGVRLVPGEVLRVGVLGEVGVPVEGVVGVALNVTAVGPVGPGFLRVWPCGSVEPETSSVNFVAAGSVEPNAVVVPVDESGEVCVSGLVETDVIVDVAAWFDSGLVPADGQRVVDTRFGIGPIPPSE